MKFNRYVRSTGMPVTRVRIEHSLTIHEIAVVLALLDFDSDDLTKNGVESAVRTFLKEQGSDKLWAFNPEDYEYDVDELAETLTDALLELYGVPADLRKAK